MTAHISRRHVLTFAGLTAGVAWVDLGASATPALADPAAGDLTIEPVADQPVAVLSPTGAVPAAVPRHLAVRILNPGLDLVAGTRLTVAFDSRIYSLMPVPVLTLGQRKVAATVSTTTDPETKRSVCTLTLGEPVPARTARNGDLIALLGTANANSYPNDLVTAPTAATAAVGGRGHQADRSLKPNRGNIPGTAVRPWGVRVGGGWTRLTWGAGDQFWYHYPTIVSLTGTGPNRTPEAEFTVTVDPRMVTKISVAAARLNGKAHATSKITRVDRVATGSQLRLSWRTGVRLDVDDQLDVILQVGTHKPAGALPTITHPVVSTGMGKSPAARQTGLLSLTRTDSVWE
jgi:hypothetical protein